MKNLSISLLAIVILSSFKGAITYNPSHDGDYIFKDAKGKGHAWQIMANPKHPNRVDFLMPHQPKVLFSANMTDATHFRTKAPITLRDSSGQYARAYDTQGEFIDSATLQLHMRVKRIAIGMVKTILTDTDLAYTYQRYVRPLDSGYPADVNNGD